MFFLLFLYLLYGSLSLDVYRARVEAMLRKGDQNVSAKPPIGFRDLSPILTLPINLQPSCYQPSADFGVQPSVFVLSWKILICLESDEAWLKIGCVGKGGED